MSAKYDRIMLKISGEAMAGDLNQGIDTKTVAEISKIIQKLVNLKVQVMIVVGGGNFWRGRSSEDMDRTASDYIGMLGTVMNGLALKDSLRQIGLKARLQSSIEMQAIAEGYSKDIALESMENGEVIIFVSGLGHPYFSTDTTAAQRAAELNAEVILSAKQGVDGVYDSDPKLNPKAKKFDELTYKKVLELGLQIQDLTATSLCLESKIPSIIFGIDRLENIIDVVNGENLGTILKGD